MMGSDFAARVVHLNAPKGNLNCSSMREQQRKVCVLRSVVVWRKKNKKKTQSSEGRWMNEKRMASIKCAFHTAFDGSVDMALGTPRDMNGLVQQA